MTILYLSYITGDHRLPINLFIIILITEKRSYTYMFLLELLPCIKASFSSFSSSFLKAWYFFDVQTSELKSDNSFTPVPILIAMYAISPPNQDQFFQRVGGYENIEIVERIHLKFFKHMYILNLKSCTSYHIWFLIVCLYLF